MLKHYLGGRKQLDSLESDASRQAVTGRQGGGGGGGGGKKAKQKKKNCRKTQLQGEAFRALQGAPDCLQYAVHPFVMSVCLTPAP